MKNTVLSGKSDAGHACIGSREGKSYRRIRGTGLVFYRFSSRLGLFACLCVAVCLLGCKADKECGRCTRVLMIGNSFSISCLSHLPQVAADRGVDLDLASLYIGGCSLKCHWENVERDGDKNFHPYLFGRNRFGKFSESKMNVCEALRLAKWDIVTVQQASHDSWRGETYHPYGDKLIAKIRELAPQAKIFVQETWSYTPWDGRLKSWKLDQGGMYDKLHAVYADFAKRNGLDVIPFGTAIQQWRSRLPVKYTERSFGGDVVGGRGQTVERHFKRGTDNAWEPNCDVFHLNEKGEYFQSLVWAVKLFGVDLSDIAYKPDFVTGEEAKLMREIAMGLAWGDVSGNDR